MNNHRRKDISKIIETINKINSELESVIGKIEDVQNEEQEYLDNMPESLQYSEKAQMAEEAVSNIESTRDSISDEVETLKAVADDLHAKLEEAVDSLEAAKG